MALYTHIKGPVKYTVVGSPTIVGGVASGFSANDFVYAILGSAPAMTDIIELGIAVTPSSIKSCGLFGRGNAYYAGIYINSAGKPFVRYQKNSDNSALASSVTSDVTMQNNIKYYIKMLKTVDTLSISVSTDNSTWITNSTGIDTSDILTFGLFNIGYGNSAVGGVLNGSIDLNHTYITVNGLPRFGSCPVRAKFRTGLAKYNVVGSPTVEDGILSMEYFNNQNYAQIPSLFDYVNNDFHIQFRVKNDTSSTGNFFGFGNGQYVWGRLTNTTFLFAAGSNASQRIRLDGTFDYGKFYYLKIEKSGSITTIGYSKDSVTWTEASAELTYTNENYKRIILGLAPYQWTAGINGSIDLNKTFIKVNGQYWFRGFLGNADTYTLHGPDYLVRDGKLVWANPKLYLKKPPTDPINSIDSGVATTENTKIEVTALLEDVEKVDAQYFIIGVRMGGATSGRVQNFCILNHQKDNINYLAHWLFPILKYEEFVYPTGHKFTASLSKDGFYVDGVLVGAGSTSFTPGTVNIGICGTSEPGTADEGMYRKAVNYIRTYQAKIYENDILLRHFVPVPAGLQIGDYTVPKTGMWDIVNQKLHTNTDDGEFKIGKDI